MSSKPATKAHMTVRINEKMLEQLDALAARLGRTRTELVDRAIEEFLAARSEPGKINRRARR